MQVKDENNKWVNTSVFTEARDYFKKNGYYTPEPWGSLAWYNFWKKERHKCLHGVNIDGHKITGEHYFYLNYCPINKSKQGTKKVGIKVLDFPDFWDGDYEYFWAREIARNGMLTEYFLTPEEVAEYEDKDDEDRHKKALELYEKANFTFKILPLSVKDDYSTSNLLGGKDLIVLKARRKGFSFKNASVAAGNLVHKAGTYTMLMAFEKRYLYPKGIFSMVTRYIAFINEHTAWKVPTDYIDRQDHIRNSYVEYKNGIKIEKGFLSEVQAISFKDNPQAGVGKDCYDIIGEEVGVWGVPGGLLDTVEAMLPSIVDGGIRTGMMTLFGTANDIEKGTVDFAEMFQSPRTKDFLPFIDIWGETENNIEGFFFPVQLNLVGFYDENGNSDYETATKEELKTRQKRIDGGATVEQINKRKREFPVNSEEALNTTEHSILPVEELKLQLKKVVDNKWQELKGTPVRLEEVEGGRVIAKPILNKSIEPITSYRLLPDNVSGCFVVYEHPIEGAPKGLYKIGYDPVEQDKGTSLAGIIVYKSVHMGTSTKDCIVGEYIGRFEEPDDIDDLARKIAIFYNTQIMHENMSTSVKNYFRRIKRLDLLAAQPDTVISKNIKNSKVARVFGCHMTPQLKEAGLRYVKTWLTQVVDYDENGTPIKNLDKIYSKRLLEELIAYNTKGNFDLVSSLFMALFQVQEETLGKVYNTKNVKSNYQQFIDIMNSIKR